MSESREPLVIHCCSGAPSPGKPMGRQTGDSLSRKQAEPEGRVNAAGDRTWLHGSRFRTDGEWVAVRQIGEGEVRITMSQRELKAIIAKSGWVPSPLRQRQVWERIAKERLDALESARRSL